jgi:hypothetical protein
MIGPELITKEKLGFCYTVESRVLFGQLLVLPSPIVKVVENLHQPKKGSMINSSDQL